MYQKVKQYIVRNLHLDSQSHTEIIKIIYIYRYLSWFITSLAYLAGPPVTIIKYKFGVILSLFFLSKLISDLYIKNKDKMGMLRLLVLIETFGITLLLLPTGGLSSPFIWYALNPILVAACYLPIYFPWMNLIIYLTAGSFMSYVFFNSDNRKLLPILRSYSELALILSLITLVVQLLSSLTKKLYMQAEALEQSNAQKKESMDHIMSLYKIIEALNNHNSKEMLIQTLAEYTAKLTKSDLCFIYISNTIEDRDYIISNIKSNYASYKSYVDLIKTRLDNNDLKAQEIQIDDDNFIAVPIILTASSLGLIAIKESTASNEDQFRNYELLEFISGLFSVTLERFNQEDIEENLIKIEEQNRIANEMHDSVSQRLFSISYAIHGLLGRWNIMPKDELKDYLMELNETSNNAMKELRNSIYKLSSKKNGLKSLQVTLNEFISSTSKLHNINIDYNMKGDEVLVNLSLKQGITRIIREACSNAIRHGDCTNIYIDLCIEKNCIKLLIKDDGNGFSLDNSALDKGNGLGLSNMRNLVAIFGGAIDIKSELKIGTEIQIIIPLHVNQVEVEQGGFAV